MEVNKVHHAAGWYRARQNMHRLTHFDLVALLVVSWLRLGLLVSWLPRLLMIS